MIHKFITYIKTSHGLTVVSFILFTLYIVLHYLVGGDGLASMKALVFGAPFLIGLILVRGIIELFIKRKKGPLFVVGLVFILVGYYLYPLAATIFYSNQIDRVSNREATDVSSCEVIEYGYHGCGGPAWYFIYSTETTDVEKLEKLVAKHYQVDKKKDERLMLASTCDKSMKPDLILENNTCIGQGIFPGARSLGNGEYEQVYERFEKLAR